MASLSAWQAPVAVRNTLASIAGCYVGCRAGFAAPVPSQLERCWVEMFTKLIRLPLTGLLDGVALCHAYVGGGNSKTVVRYFTTGSAS